MRLLIIKIVAIALAIECYECATQKRSVDIQPVKVEEIQIDDSQLNPNEIPLVVKPVDLTGESEGTGINTNDPYSETMEVANNLVFRPLFSYRKQNVERRSLTNRQQSRRGDTTAGGGGYGKYGPPPYLVYNRQTGTYYPYYYYPKYNSVRRG